MRGRKPALDDNEVERVRWMYANTSNSMEKIGQHFGVSQGVIQHVIDRKGAYALRDRSCHIAGEELD